MRFTKMHGAGNDFIIIDNISGTIPEERLSPLAAELCRRRLSVGADGMMVLTKPRDGGDVAMLFYNSDGSLGEMCGNGARCLAAYAFEKGLAGEKMRIETTAGNVYAQREDKLRYRVLLNLPEVIDPDRETGSGERCVYIELGNPGLPHAVFLRDEIDTEKLRAEGKKYRYDPAFPKGANVSFAKLSGENRVEAVTYERGVEDFTLACGTGCGAIVTALEAKGLASGEGLSISMPGGELWAGLKKENGKIRELALAGPVKFVFEGELCI